MMKLPNALRWYRVGLLTVPSNIGMTNSAPSPALESIWAISWQLELTVPEEPSSHQPSVWYPKWNLLVAVSTQLESEESTQGHIWAGPYAEPPVSEVQNSFHLVRESMTGLKPQLIHFWTVVREEPWSLKSSQPQSPPSSELPSMRV